MARPTLGAELVDRLPGSDFARERMRVVVEVLCGTLSVQDAAARLGVSPQYFDQLRAAALAAGVAALEPKPVGRPPTVHPEAPSAAGADGGSGSERSGGDENTALRIELRAAQLREELALVLGPRYRRTKKTPDDDEIEATDTPILAASSPAQHRRDLRHQRFLADVARTGYRRAPRFLLRACDRQRPYRQCEAVVRRAALAFRRWAAWHGISLNQTAALLGLDRSTILEWQSRRADPFDRLKPRPFGPPAYVCSASERQLLLEFLALHPGSDVLDLVCHFPHIPYRELLRFHTVHGVNLRDRRSLDHLPRIIWEKPGRVWAMDFTFPDQPIDGCFRGILCVRDLASGYTLAADPVVTDDAMAAISTLNILFRVYDAPLVLKMDNGPAFTSAVFRTFLERNQVTILYSPPYTPTFNGAVEAGNGVIKSHAEYIACLAGSPGLWSSDHVEGARLWANANRPKNRTHSADHDWQHRTALADGERTAFANLLAAAMQRRQQEADLLAQHAADKAAQAAQASIAQVAEQMVQRTLASPAKPNTITPDAIRRHAIADALTYTGNLHIKSRRISQPVPRAIGLQIA